ncbi:MAG: GNAT family N-acetyltransferase [Clostridia bacterium]|nr:GNAT family N-acetyltransferase [Clostridia bacterium]
MRTETIRTERLILRRLRPEDSKQLHENCSSDEAVVKYLARGACADPEITKALAGRWIDLYETDDFFLWAVEFGGQVIGTVNLHDIDRAAGKCGIGFSIGSNWWNRGIMTEAAGAAVKHALNELGFLMITGWCAAENRASARVMEKIGMKAEARTEMSVRLSSGEYADQIWYSIRREEGEEEE